MYLLELIGFLESYSLPTLALSAVVAVLTFILRKLFAEKFSAVLSGYLPFALGIVFYTAYDMIFVSKAFCFRTEVLSAGILCGSLSSLYFAVAGGITKKGIARSALALTLEGVIAVAVQPESVTAAAVALEKLLDETGFMREDETQRAEMLKVLTDETFKILKIHQKPDVSDQELLAVAELTAQAAQSIAQGEKSKKINP